MQAILASYPRSGNTWLRYIIEYFSKSPTIGYAKATMNHPENVGLGKHAENLNINLNAKPIIIKRHTIPRNEINSMPIILLVRNYKECIVRQNQDFKDANKGFFDNDISNTNAGRCDYSGLFNVYESWTKPKVVVYYEDLILKPKEVIDTILDFLEIKPDKEEVEKFIREFSYHKSLSLKLYKEFAGGTESNGDSVIFHSKKLSSKTRKEYDRIIKLKNPIVFYRYLERYKDD